MPGLDLSGLLLFLAFDFKFVHVVRGELMLHQVVYQVFVLHFSTEFLLVQGLLTAFAVGDAS